MAADRVLVVEDDETNADEVHDALLANGYEVSAVSGGRAAPRVSPCPPTRTLRRKLGDRPDGSSWTSTVRTVG